MWTTAKVFDVQVYQQMCSQFTCCIETLCTFTANIRFHTFMSHYMYLKVTTMAEFLLTNVTCEPNTFIVWLQQMCLELIMKCKTIWTASTWVRLCTSVNTYMKLQIRVSFKRLPTVTTVIMSYVAVYMTFMSLQSARLTKTFVTQWTLVRFVSRVDSHVNFSISRHAERLVTQVTFVRFLSTVNSAVHNKVSWLSKSFATNSTFKRFVSRMTSPVYC